MRTRGIFRTLVYWELEAYSEHWYIYKPCILRTNHILRTRTCWELCQTSNAKHIAKIVNSYNYFHNISFSSSQLYEKNMAFLNAGLVFTLEVYILCKKEMGAESARAMNIYRWSKPRVVILYKYDCKINYIKEQWRTPCKYLVSSYNLDFFHIYFYFMLGGSCVGKEKLLNLCEKVALL